MILNERHKAPFISYSAGDDKCWQQDKRRKTLAFIKSLLIVALFESSLDFSLLP